MGRFEEVKQTTKTIRTEYNYVTYMIDIVQCENGTREAWIYVDFVGAKELMFGMQDRTEEDFIDLVKASFESYADKYEDEYII